MSKYSDLKGVWVHSFPEGSDDYVSEYVISGSEDSPVVSAHDLSDGEQFVVSDVNWSGGKLIFKTYMPSTERIGINEFTLGENGVLTSKFTFTVIERFHRKST